MAHRSTDHFRNFKSGKVWNMKRWVMRRDNTGVRPCTLYTFTVIAQTSGKTSKKVKWDKEVQFDVN